MPSAHNNGLSVFLGQFTRNYTQTVKRAADNKRRYAPGWVHSTCLLRGFPKGAAPHLAHDFAEQSVVCYTLCRRCPENTVAAGEGNFSPISVREYSTCGGISSYCVRSTSPFSTRDLSCTDKVA